MTYAVSAPRNWFALSEVERSSRTKLSADLCTIDGNEHYVRGVVEIPILNSREHLEYGVWVSVSEESMGRIVALSNAERTDDEPPRFGWLDTWLPGYPAPREIRCHVQIQADNLRPLIILQPTEYPLSVEQHEGITLDRVKEIAASAGHV